MIKNNRKAAHFGINRMIHYKPNWASLSPFTITERSKNCIQGKLIKTWRRFSHFLGNLWISTLQLHLPVSCDSNEKICIRFRDFKSVFFHPCFSPLLFGFLCSESTWKVLVRFVNNESSDPSGRSFSLVSVARSDQTYFCSPLDGMLVHHVQS